MIFPAISSYDLETTKSSFYSNEFEKVYDYCCQIIIYFSVKAAFL